MGLAHAVDADPDIVVAGCRDRADVVLVDQGAVRGEPDVETERLRAMRDLEDVGPEQRLAAREDQHRHPERSQIVHDREDLRGGEFAREVAVRGDGAVLAGEVAAPDQVPDHHRSPWFSSRPKGSGLDQLAHVLGDSEHGQPSGVSAGSGHVHGSAASGGPERRSRRETKRVIVCSNLLPLETSPRGLKKLTNRRPPAADPRPRRIGHRRERRPPRSS